MKKLGLVFVGLVALAVFALELDQFTKPGIGPLAEPVTQEQSDPAWAARRDAAKAERQAKKDRIEAILTKLEADGVVTREDLVEHLTNEVLEDADLENLCREHEEQDR